MSPQWYIMTSASIAWRFPTLWGTKQAAQASKYVHSGSRAHNHYSGASFHHFEAFWHLNFDKSPLQWLSEIVSRSGETFSWQVDYQRFRKNPQHSQTQKIEIAIYKEISYSLKKKIPAGHSDLGRCSAASVRNMEIGTRYCQDPKYCNKDAAGSEIW